MIKNKIIVLLCLSFGASFLVSVSWAGDIDLSVETNLTEPILVTPEGVFGEFSLTLTNHGPDTAGVNNPNPLPFPNSIFADSIYSSFDEENNYYAYPVIFAQNTAIAQDCNFSYLQPSPVPGDPPQIGYYFTTPALSAGESVTCYGLYSAFFYDRTRTMDIGWSSFEGNDNDTDPSNDRAVLTFQAYNPPQPVPSFTFYGLLLLILTVLGLALRTQKQK